VDLLEFTALKSDLWGSPSYSISAFRNCKKSLNSKKSLSQIIDMFRDVNYPSRICLAYVDGVIASVQILAILVRNDWPFSFGTGGHFAAEYTCERRK